VCHGSGVVLPLLAVADGKSNAKVDLVLDQAQHREDVWGIGGTVQRILILVTTRVWK
jgi:hypothetical protein